MSNKEEEYLNQFIQERINDVYSQLKKEEYFHSLSEKILSLQDEIVNKLATEKERALFFVYCDTSCEVQDSLFKAAYIKGLSNMFR